MKKNSDGVIFSEPAGFRPAKLIYTRVVFKILLSLKKAYFKEPLWMAASVRSHPVYIYAKITLRCHYFNFYLMMTLSKFTEHLPASNKVRYPISGRNDFTVLLRCGGPAKLYLWKISSLHYIWCFPLRISFANGDKSAGICGLVLN